MLNKILFGFILPAYIYSREAHILVPFVEYTHESHPQFSVQSNQIRVQSLLHHHHQLSSSWEHSTTWQQSHYSAQIHSTQIFRLIQHHSRGYQALGFYWRQTQLGPELGTEYQWARWNHIQGIAHIQSDKSYAEVLVHPTESTEFSMQYHLIYQWQFSWLKQVKQHIILFEYQPNQESLRLSYSYHFSFQWSMKTRITHHPSGMSTYQQNFTWIP